MTKEEALKRAKSARLVADEARHNYVILASTFGAQDSEAKRELARHDKADQAAKKWEWFADLHPSTKASLLRDRSLPAEIFGY